MSLLNTRKEIDSVKNQILNISLVFGSVVGSIVYVLSLVSIKIHGLQFSHISDLVVLIALLFITYRRKSLSIGFKSFIVITGILLVMIMDVIRLGIFSADKVFIVLIPFLAVLVYSLQKTLIIYLFALTGITIVASLHILGFLAVPPQDDIGVVPWIINILILIIVSFVVLIVTLKFNRTYENLIQQLIDSNRKITIQERNYREIFNSTIDSILLLDIKGKILDVNESVIRMFGFNMEDLMHQEIQILNSDDESFNSVQFDNYFQKAIKGEKQVFDWKARNKDGSIFWVEMVLKQTEIGGEGRILVILRDIDDKKKTALELEKHRNHLEELVKSRTEKLIESEKMASVGILAAGVAHEINNPLNFIQGGVNGLQNFFDKTPNNKQTNDVEPLLDVIKTGVKRATNIITSLNHYSRQDDSFHEDCNINTILDNCLIILHNEIKGRINVKKDYISQPVTVKGNEGKLHQVFINILSNAIQAIEKEGTIWIRTEINGKYLKTVIRDDGIGIQKDLISRISDPFFTTKEVGKGTGLGLYIAYNIVKKHNGNIGFRSEEGKGTEVNISLPVNLPDYDKK